MMTILTISDAAESLRNGTISSTELTRGILDRAIDANDDYGAYVTITADAAMEQAGAADDAFRAGIDRGPLQGIPLAIKDIIAVRGVRTTANSRVRDQCSDATSDAIVTERLRDAGAVFVGKATTSEFALGLPDPSKGFPVPRNAWNREHTPAGSSSGTAIAVAGGLALGGLGSDTGGSVRSPSAVNGITGLKVTFGRVPTTGVVPLAPSLDSVGPMARSALDCAHLLQVIAGAHGSDTHASPHAVPDYAAALTGDVEGVRIALPQSWFFDHPMLAPEAKDAVLDAVGALERLGAVVTQVDLPLAKLARDATHVIMLAEAYSYHRENLSRRWNDYGAGTRPWIARGALYSAADYVQAERVRAAFSTQVAEVFRDHDIIVTPATPGAAELIADTSVSRRLHTPSFTQPWNLAGLPAAAVPVGFSADALPLSMQVIGRPFAEATVLKIADAFQQVSDWHLRIPTGWSALDPGLVGR